MIMKILVLADAFFNQDPALLKNDYIKLLYRFFHNNPDLDLILDPQCLQYFTCITSTNQALIHELCQRLADFSSYYYVLTHYPSNNDFKHISIYQCILQTDMEGHYDDLLNRLKSYENLSRPSHQ
jgi:hypothetical protein